MDDNTSPKGNPFERSGLQLSLFTVGVGFVTVSAKPISNELADWLDFLHYFSLCADSVVSE
jgi:hypothetical protein